MSLLKDRHLVWLSSEKDHLMLRLDKWIVSCHGYNKLKPFMISRGRRTMAGFPNDREDPLETIDHSCHTVDKHSNGGSAMQVNDRSRNREVCPYKFGPQVLSQSLYEVPYEFKKVSLGNSCQEKTPRNKNNSLKDCCRKTLESDFSSDIKDNRRDEPMSADDFLGQLFSTNFSDEMREDFNDTRKNLNIVSSCENSSDDRNKELNKYYDQSELRSVTSEFSNNAVNNLKHVPEICITESFDEEDYGELERWIQHRASLAPTHNDNDVFARCSNPNLTSCMKSAARFDSHNLPDYEDVENQLPTSLTGSSNYDVAFNQNQRGTHLHPLSQVIDNYQFTDNALRDGKVHSLKHYRPSPEDNFRGRGDGREELNMSDELRAFLSFHHKTFSKKSGSGRRKRRSVVGGFGESDPVWPGVLLTFDRGVPSDKAPHSLLASSSTPELRVFV